MKTRFWFFVYFGLLLGGAARAQVNLDMPIPVGPSDKVYLSMADPKLAYVLPLSLETLSAAEIREVDGEYHVYFTVGADETALTSVNDRLKAQNKPFTARLMRGFQIAMDPRGSMDISKVFHPQLVPLGDAGDFGGPLPYMLSLKKLGSTKGLLTQKVIQQIFNGKAARHLGGLTYNFNATMGGKPYLGQTTIGIFAMTTAQKEIQAALKFAIDAVTDAPPMNIQFDSVSKCWGQVPVGTICLR
jgi:hypothetical protein